MTRKGKSPIVTDMQNSGNGMEFESALQAGLKNTGSRFPNKSDGRHRSGLLFPTFTPKFLLEFGQGLTVFTVGSCFARNIEEALTDDDLPTMSFSAPKSEWPFRSNGLLNEYNPGTMSKRIINALSGTTFDDGTMVQSGSDGGYADLLLHGGADVTLDRAIQRRAEIDAIYSRLSKADCVIVTLGYVEAWYDVESDSYLNRMPPPSFARKHPGRFLFKRLGAEASFELLRSALAGLSDAGIKVVLTVSPVPIAHTFTSDDCVLANEYSKAVLRVCADKLARHFGNVDYFPSYEIVRSGGVDAYIDDNIHVLDETVRAVVTHMIQSYKGHIPEGSAIVGCPQA